MFGVVWNQYQYNASVKTEINVTNCDIRINARRLIYGSMGQNASFGNRIKLTVKDCKFELENFLSQIIFDSVPRACDVEYCNLLIKVLDKTVTSLKLFENVENTGTFKLRNILINLQNTSFDMSTYYKSNSVKADVDGLIYLCKGNRYNSYYGSDFSDFYFAWRTGKVGLISLDGRGQFQGVIDEEWLSNKGYTKKEA